MQENIKDPYLPGRLRTWFITFGLWRAGFLVCFVCGLTLAVLGERA